MIYDDSNKKEDNVINIRKNFDTNEYHILYMDPNGGKPLIHQLTGFYHQKVLDYIYYLMKNQYIDEEGFSQFQLNMPGLPSMIVSGEKFKDVYYRDHFYDMVGFALEMLENAVSVPLPTPRSKTADPVARARSIVSQDSEVRPRHLMFFD